MINNKLSGKDTDIMKIF